MLSRWYFSIIIYH